MSNIFLSKIGILTSRIGILMYVCLLAQNGCSESKQQRIVPTLTNQHTEVNGQITDIKVVIYGERYNDSSCIILKNAQDLTEFIESAQKTITQLQSLKEKMIVTEQEKIDSSLNNVIPQPRSN